MASIDPFTGEKTWTTVNEYCEPTVQLLKGDEREIVAGGLLEKGDIIATINWQKEIDTSEPTAVAGTQYIEAVYKSKTYLIKEVHFDGLGATARQIIFLAKET